ncbi:MAG TPA: glycosyltransferase [Ilumatobacteraceae bacterium]|nr:glycosyltransferase [Ilumatobacteraceae bacterium]
MTEAATPAISVVVPTFNRLARLKLVLDALSRQTVDGTRFEVIVVSDGSTDGTDEYLDGETPLPIVHVRQDNAGPGAARNRGIQLARSRLVLFIDDDVVATPQLVERHLANHGESDSTVVIGPMLNAPEFAYSPWVAWEQAMLYKQYRAMRIGEYEATFRQFYTGNASVPAELVQRAGGFDTSFRRAEDIELSYRLDQLGARFVFDESAAGHHLAERSFDSWIAAAEAYGKNDVKFARDHDQTWLMPSMAKEFRQRNAITQQLVKACLTRPKLAAVAARAMAAIGGSRRPPEKLTSFALSGLYALKYYGGAAIESGDPAAFKRMLSSGANEPSTDA